MKNAVTWITLLLELAALRAPAESGALSPETELPKQATDQCMTSLSNGQTDEAFAELFRRYWPKKDEAIAEAKSLAADFRSATSQVEPSLGKLLPCRYEFLGVRRLGMTYFTLVYVQKHQYGALPMAFLFYKGKDGWFLNDTEVGDSANRDLDSLAETRTRWPELDLVKQATDECTRSLRQGRISEGFAGLFRRYWQSKEVAITNAESEAAAFRNWASDLESAAGKRLSGRCEFLGTRRLGHTYATFVYVQRQESEALMVAFTFYSGGEGWRLVNTTVADANKVWAALWTTDAGRLSSELDSLKQATDRCMTSTNAVQSGEAFINLYQRYWPDKEEASSKAEALTRRLRHLGALYRFNIGPRLPGQYEFIAARRLGSAYVTLFYVQKHELGVSPVSFQFYRGREDWVLVSTAWGDEGEPDKELWTSETNTASSELGVLKKAGDQCMTCLSQGDGLGAFTNLLQRYWALEEEAIAKAESLSLDLQRGTSQQESFIGKQLAGQYDLVVARRLGTTCFTLVYALKHEFGGLTLKLRFWKGNGRWFLRETNVTNDPRSAIDLFGFAEPAK